MASYRRAAWYLCWWGCLFGVLQVADGAERISIPQPSIQDLLNRANPVINENSLGYVQAHDSNFQYQQRSYSAPVQTAVKVPSAAIKDALKGALKQQAAVVVATAVVSAAVAAAGWVIDEAGQPVKKTDGGEATTNPEKNEYFWYFKSNPEYGKFSSATKACSAAASQKRIPDKGASQSPSEANTFECMTTDNWVYGRVGRDGASCPADTNYSDLNGACYGKTSTALVDADYETLTSVVDSLGADMRARLAKAACEGSLSPARCYQALQDAASFLNSGPSSIQGPSTTSSTTFKNADGTTTTSTTTKDTKFGMQYDGTGATATPTTTTTTKDSKGNESTTVDKEDEDSSSGTAPKEDEKETPSPCTTNCDGPAYKDLYTKTDVTKEGVLDTYAAKVKALPIMSAVGNFFTVNGGGSCPVWSGTIEIGWGQSVTLSNDFACQPWFTALSPAFHAVLMLVAAWLAFRVSILD